MFRILTRTPWAAKPALKPSFFSGNLRRLATVQPPVKPKKLTFKEMAKQYGWVATGVYLGLSAIDLPIFFGLVHFSGHDWIVNSERNLRKWVGLSTDESDFLTAKALNSSHGQVMAEFSVAYVLHKMFIVVRIPVAMAITPKVAEKLGQWGFKVKKGLPAVDTKVFAEKAKDLKK